MYSMYSYNSMPRNSQNMCCGDNRSFQSQSDDRFFPGGFIAPLLLGGVAGYAIGNNRPNNYYPQPYYVPGPVYYSNNYYPYY